MYVDICHYATFATASRASFGTITTLYTPSMDSLKASSLVTSFPGSTVDVLVKHVGDKEAVFTRLARDIFRSRGKSVSPSRISDYHQLYPCKIPAVERSWTFLKGGTDKESAGHELSRFTAYLALAEEGGGGGGTTLLDVP